MARRRGAEDSATRLSIIERAIGIIEAEGCAAVTAGRITRDLKLSRHSVHYYFGTIEELFVAIMRHEGEMTKGWYEEVLASENPLRLIWEHPGPSDPKAFEFVVLALRSEAIGAEVRRSTEELRRMFTRAIERHLEMRGIAANVPAIALGIIILGISRTLAEGASLGISDGHNETRALVEEWIDAFERDGTWPSAEKYVLNQ